MTENLRSNLITKNNLAIAAAVSVLLLLLFAMFLRLSPAYAIATHRDSGAFLYGGQRILHGELLYRDLWDHKPPVIFYINAVATWLGGGSLWGIWIVEFVLLTITVLLSLHLLSRLFGLAAGFLGTLTWLAGLFPLLRLNHTEDYALVLQFAALWLFVQMLRSEHRMRSLVYGFVTGVMLGLLFMIRQNLISVGLAIGVYLLWQGVRSRDWGQLARQLAPPVVGGLVVLVPVFLYFMVRGTLSFFWDSAFHYNFIYSNATLYDNIITLIRGFRVLTPTGVIYLALGVWGAGVVGLFNSRHANEKTALIVVAVIAVPIEFILSTASGRPYSHYYIAWLPFLGVLGAHLAELIINGLNARFDASEAAPMRLTLPVVVVFTLVMTWLSVGEYLETMPPRWGFDLQNAEAAINYLNDNTEPETPVYVWGNEPIVYYLSNTRSPTRFHHLTPLLTPGYQSQALIDELMTDLQAEPPQYIIDTSSTATRVPPIDPEDREGWLVRMANPRTAEDRSFVLMPEMDVVFDYILTNYERLGRLERNGWIVYVYRGATDS